MCRQACPVGHVTSRETYTPHGWALVIESVARKQLAWTRETSDVMFACADCGLCQAHCVTDQPLPDAINRARVELTSAGLAPQGVYELDRQLRSDGGAYGAVPARSGDLRSDVVLFVGDAAQHFGRAADAALRLLAAAGIQAEPVGAGRSTGAVAASVGLQQTAIHLATAVRDEVLAAGAKEVLVLSPADRWAFEHVYPVRLGVEWPADIKVREVVDVLAEAHADGRLHIRCQPAGTYAYHDPSHSARVAARRPAPRSLLAAALGADAARDLFFREHRAHPAGTVGGLEVTHPRIADGLTDGRIEDARRAGAAWLVTEDPLDQHQLASRAAGKTEVKGLYELLADRVGG
jgi:Fe-S oxidoreductase